MDNIQKVKSYARVVREQMGVFQVNLTHSQTLETVISLLSERGDWNQYSASERTIGLPTTVATYFRAVVRTQRRLLRFDPRHNRGWLCMAAMHYLEVLSKHENQSSTHLLVELLDQADVQPLAVPAGGDLLVGGGHEALNMRLGTWFLTQHLNRDPKNREFPWDATERLAWEMGFSVEDARLIRQVQREAPNHVWDLICWFEVGVLDPDQKAFLRELRDQAGWQVRFRDLYASNSHTS